MIWIVAYLIIGVVFALMGLYGMSNTDKSTAYKVKITIGLVTAWPIMVGGALLMAAVFMGSGGLF